MKAHRHTGLDSPKVSPNNISGIVTPVLTATDQTVAGTKTFSAIPVLPASNPTTANQMARKAYADSLDPASYEITGSSDAADLIDEATDEETTTSLSPIKKKEIRYNEEDGTITTSFQLMSPDSANAARGQIYINGVAAGTRRSTDQPDYQTYTEDIAVETGDLVQLYIWRVPDATVAQCTNLKLYYKKTLTVTAGTVNLN